MYTSNFYYNLTGLALPPYGSAIMEGGEAEGVLRPSQATTPQTGSRVDTRRYKHTSKHASHSDTKREWREDEPGFQFLAEPRLDIARQQGSTVIDNSRQLSTTRHTTASTVLSSRQS